MSPVCANPRPVAAVRPRALPAALGVALSLLLSAAAAHSAEAARTLIVLDGSGSMWGEIDGRPKLEIARETVSRVVGALPKDREVGLMAYGHRRQGDCADIELIVPPAAGSLPAVLAAVKALRFQGKTPLSAALVQAAAALRATEAPATVVLVTDGIETCAADPCAVARELERSGVGFTAHVIGFGLTRAEGAQVACIAAATGGRYLEARDAGSLGAALSETLAAPAPVPEPPATHFPGAPLMPNVALDPTGRAIGAGAPPVRQASFPPDGTAAQCQAACAADAACAAWRYEPKGSLFVDHARCVAFDGAVELDYSRFDPAEGWASGIKDGYRLLTKPYLIAVTFSADAGEAPVSWSAVPLPGQGGPTDERPAEAWAPPEASAEPVTAELLPGTYEVSGTLTEGPDADAAFVARVTVSPTGETRFTIPRAAR